MAGVGFVALIVAVAPARAMAAANPCGSLAGPPATYAHVVVIMEENAASSKVIGSPDAPYFNLLAHRCARASNYHETASVSQPNYMAATGGYSTGVGVHDDAPSIFGQVGSWIELEESMGGPCGGAGTFYKHGHDPAFFYTPMAAECPLYDLPMTASDGGATGLPATLPAYTWITPNLCHDDHWEIGCSEPASQTLQAMDTWLSGTVSQITATPDYLAGSTLILVTFDESSTTGTKVPMVAVAAGIHRVKDPTLYDHYALLRASEEALGITTYLGNAETANDMRLGMGF